MSSKRGQLALMGLATSIAALMVTLGSVALIRASERQAAVARLVEETALVAMWAETLPPTGDTQELAHDIAARLGVRISLIAADGTVIGDSSRDRDSLARMDNHLERPEIRDARLGTRGLSRRRSGTTNVDYFFAARVVPGGGPVRFVRLALSAREMGHVRASHLWLIAALAGVSTFPLGIFGYFRVRRLSGPLDRIAQDIERSVKSGFREPLPIPTTDSEEISRLGAAISRLHLALLERIATIDHERTTLSSVMAGMREGLMLVDADRRVRLANAALKRILDLRLDPEGHVFEEVVRQPTVVHDIDSALSRHGPVRESIISIPGSDRVFELHVTQLAAAKGDGHEVLALFVDVTRLDRLEKVRREFVANVSHELRTPLTSIKAFVENLIDGGIDDPDDSLRFLEIVRRNTNHMGELIEDLTDLSLIETGSIMLELRRVDADVVAREIADKLRPLAVARDVDVQIQLAATFQVTADRRRLEQMLTNLINNAIKFNREGGRVVIDGQVSDSTTTLTIEDTGIGIPSNNQEKVFERFFQVNRDRSRAVGGTGLGLSIVKHLMRLHGGNVGVESELGHGSRFTLTFPTTEARRNLVAMNGGVQ